MKLNCRLAAYIIGMSIAVGTLACVPNMDAYAAGNIGRVTADSLNVRVEAKDGADVIGKVSGGEEIEILGQDGDWYEIEYQGKTGYVAADYIAVDESTSEESQDTSDADTEASEVEDEVGKTSGDNSKLFILLGAIVVVIIIIIITLKSIKCLDRDDDDDDEYDDDEYEEDDDYYEEPVRRRKASRYEEDDDYEEAPARRRASRYEEDDDYDEEPVRRRRRPDYDEEPARRRSTPAYDEQPVRRSASAYDEQPVRRSTPEYEAPKPQQRSSVAYSDIPVPKPQTMSNNPDDYRIEIDPSFFEDEPSANTSATPANSSKDADLAAAVKKMEELQKEIERLKRDN